MSAKTNTAAYLTATKAPLEVKPSTYPVPGDDEVIIKTRAIAFNPVDTGIQELGPDVFTFITLPAILGYDVAGEIEAIGKSVTKFHIGDRVAGLAERGLQHHVAIAEHLTTPIPASLPFTQAAVLPLALSTAVKALFHPDYLGLSLPLPPSQTPAAPAAKGKTVLICGGSTSVGSNAIQLAVAAGYEVVSTASPRNFAYVKALGAGAVFDYASPTVREDVLGAFEGTTAAGVVANAGLPSSGDAEVVEMCVEVVRRAGVGEKKLVALTMVPSWGPEFEGVECRFVLPLRGDIELAEKVFHDFLPEALAEGKFRALPTAQVVGEGLEAAQGALDLLKKGVSAKKIVVTL